MKGEVLKWGLEAFKTSTGFALTHGESTKEVWGKWGRESTKEVSGDCLTVLRVQL